MSSLINIPDFLLNDIHLDKISKKAKILLLVYGKILGLILKIPNSKLLAFILNLLYGNSGKIGYDNGFFTKEYPDNKVIHFSNKRILRVIRGVDYQFSKILDDYCVGDNEIKNGDTVVDCGANVGEFYLALNQIGLKVKYFAFEPDVEPYSCLEKNIKSDNCLLYNFGLSDKNEEKTFYIGSESGDSSLENFGTENQITINTKRLDSLEFKKIDFLKIDAEGHELEVLKGSVEHLKFIKYISVDYGMEKGLSQDSTIVEVTNFLYENNFLLCKANLNRNVGLFKNKALN